MGAADAMSTRKPEPTTRAKGRPPKGAAPALPGEEVDRLLVFGEVVTCDDGKSQTVAYPSYRDIAERFGVSTTLVAKYAKDHNCIRRRSQAQARIQAQADQKLVELRATAVALSKDDELRIIDSYLAGFEKALSEGRVRFDNPGDFNTMVRLKEFVMGGADSRQEIHASLSLEDIQARHQRMIRVVNEAGVPARGELPGPTSGVVLDAHAIEASGPPRGPIADAAGDLNVHLRGAQSGSAAAPADSSRRSSFAHGPTLEDSVVTGEHAMEGVSGSANGRVTQRNSGVQAPLRAEAADSARVLPRASVLLERDSDAHEVPGTRGQVNTQRGVHFESPDDGELGPDGEVPNGH